MADNEPKDSGAAPTPSKKKGETNNAAGDKNYRNAAVGTGLAIGSAAIAAALLYYRRDKSRNTPRK